MRLVARHNRGRPRGRARLAALCAVALLGAACASPPSQPPATQAQIEAAIARRNIGVDYVVNGRVAMGLRELQHANTLYDGDALTHLWLGQAYRLRGRNAEALVHAARAVELDPANQEARLNLSSIYSDHAEYEKSIVEATTLIEDPTFPTPWRALTNRGWAQFKLGYISDARASLMEALDFEPRYWPALLDLGIVAMSERDYVQAIRYFSEVIALGPGPGPEAEANYRTAEAYVAIGRRAQAIRHLTVAIEQAPNGRWGRESRDYLKRLQ